MTNAQKTPLSRTLPAFARQITQQEIAQLGLGTPGEVISVSGAIVTINFQVTGLTLPQVTMPLGSPEYIRLPIQPGDKGVAVPASFYLGGISGLGSGTADATQYGNLATLYWVPIGSKNFSSTNVNPNQVVIYGPEGVALRDTENAASIVIVPSSITLSAGGHTVAISSNGVVIDGVTFAAHMHLPGTFNVDGSPVIGDSGIVQP